ncbi:hypothetical protein [Bythopirellula polymerisocia]|uniref:Uncharacterized protein n=1 Tax=Bythopirellula polymerisocia TaxID=2528003 RepID=A0A5C6CEJ8_9BACT|nr:hypothetical protein [Bythopirellula polymerisocia]TWU21934.1 hypothetical protein Pla144_44010 [Bythopirellula polymerisocia]
MTNPILALKQLESLKREFDSQSAQQKKTCLDALKSAHLKSADQIARLHEVLCFMQAWPDNEAILSSVDAMLERFEQRPDLKKHADELLNSGIAGTPINFRFYAGTTKWLADRWPEKLHIDWEDFENAEKLEGYLSLLASYSETPGLDNITMELPEWINRLKGPHETDALFVIRRLAVVFFNEFLHEQQCDELDIPLILSPGAGVPSRTLAKRDHSPIHYQTDPLVRTRPVPSEEIHRSLKPPKLINHAEGTRFVDLARCAMVTRQRDLDAFSYADANDVSVLDDGDLQFVLCGVVPERRFLLESLYGFLVLKNGVPISYGAITSLFNSAEVAYTILDSFRGSESARIYVRTLAMVYHVFGCDTFTITPYQLGEENDDALKSGAWWFYQKLGYLPRDKKLKKLMEQEMSTMKRRPRHRSSLAVLKQLATENVFLDLNKRRDDVLGVLDLAKVGLKITDLFAKRFGWEREQGEKALAAEAASTLGVASFRGWSAGEKLAWQRWSPIVALLDDLQRWPTADQEALVQIIRAKGGRQELDYLRGFDGLVRLRKAVEKLTV